MRKLNVRRHTTDRDQAQKLVAAATTPGARRRDRAARDTLRDLRRGIGECGGAEQLLHGEPHPGNVLTTKNGLLFIISRHVVADPSNSTPPCARRSQRAYPGATKDCSRLRILVLAMITTWRWDRGDQLPTGAGWAQSGSARSERARAETEYPR